MKDLLESIFNAGSDWRYGMTMMGNPITFVQWYEQNKSKIDAAIDSYLESQGKAVVKGTKVTRQLRRYELQEDPQEIDYDFGDLNH